MTASSENLPLPLNKLLHAEPFYPAPAPEPPPDPSPSTETTQPPPLPAKASLAKTTAPLVYQQNNCNALKLDTIDAHRRTKHNRQRPHIKAIDTLLRKAVMNITNSNDLVIQMADKKVSICIQEKPNYIHIALDHLSDILTYKRVSLQEIPHILDPQFYRKALETLFDKYSIKHDQLLQFILQWKHHKVEADPSNPLLNLPYFYGLLKLHKQKISLRPIISQTSSQLTPPSSPLSLVTSNANSLRRCDHWPTPSDTELPTLFGVTSNVRHHIHPREHRSRSRYNNNAQQPSYCASISEAVEHWPS